MWIYLVLDQESLPLSGTVDRALVIVMMSSVLNLNVFGHALPLVIWSFVTTDNNNITVIIDRYFHTIKSGTAVPFIGVYNVHCTCVVIIYYYFTDDSEPILGQWFEQTLSPNEDTQARPVTPPTLGTEEGGTEGGKHSKKHLTVKNASVVPDKKEPHAVSVTWYNGDIFSKYEMRNN